MKKQKKQFVVRKYVIATSAREAIKLEAQHPVEEVYVDMEWLRSNPPPMEKKIGF